MASNGHNNPLVNKLSSLARISDADRDVLDQVIAQSHSIGPETVLIRQGDKPTGVYLIKEGIACRYKYRDDEARQIMAFLVPGDFCDLDIALLEWMDHSIATVSPCEIVHIDKEVVLDLLRNHPSIAHALRLATLVDEATMREWLVNIGLRTSEQRVAHLFCELLVRLHAVDERASTPHQVLLRQSDIAAATGLSIVHVSRAMTRFKNQGFLVASEDHFTVLNEGALRDFAGFDPEYLHLGGRSTS